MADAPDRFFTRRGLVLALASLATPAVTARPKVVTILGNSITAGLGLPADQALPARLQAALARLGAPATVRGAGVSGDTTADGLARLGFSVQPDTDVCVVALGGNDLLQGLDPAAIRANLEAIVARLKARRIGVVLAGIAAPAAVAAGYARDFNAVFPAVARAARAPLYPDILAGVGPALRQGNGIHPDAAGAALIAARLRAHRRQGAEGQAMIRLFAAIAIPDEIAEGLARRQQGLPGAKWRPLEALHLTLRFMGDVRETVAEDLDGELAAIGGEPLTLTLEGVGAFGEGDDLRAVWAGVADNLPLRRLAARCESAARRAGLAPDRRAFRPHVTLAYLKRAEPARVAAWIQGHNLLKSPPFPVTGFGLYSSWRGGQSSTYRLEASYPLG